MAEIVDMRGMFAAPMRMPAMIEKMKARVEAAKAAMPSTPVILTNQPVPVKGAVATGMPLIVKLGLLGVGGFAAFKLMKRKRG